MNDENNVKSTASKGNLFRSGVVNVITTLVASALIGLFGINGIKDIWPGGENKEMLSSDLSQPNSNATTTTLISGVHSESSDTSSSSVTPPKTSAPDSTTPATASFSNDVLTQLVAEGHSSFSSLPLSKTALQQSTNHENATKMSLSTAMSPNQCEWASEKLFFKQSGTCVLKITIPAVKKSLKFKDFSTTVRIPVRLTTFSSPERFSPHFRISANATGRGNFLTYGKELPEEMTVGDAKNYWHMKLNVTLQQPNSAPGLSKCFRIYARYFHGKSSYNDFTDDILGCSELTGTSGTKEYCVNFQPSWYKRNSASQEAFVLKDSSGAVAADDFTKIKFTYIGWGVEWGWDNFNTSSKSGLAWSATEIQQAEALEARPLVNVLEIKSGKCP